MIPHYQSSVRLRHLIKQAADLFGVTPADMRLLRGGRYAGGRMPPAMAARLAYLVVVHRHQMATMRSAQAVLGSKGGARKSMAAVAVDLMADPLIAAKLERLDAMARATEVAA